MGADGYLTAALSAVFNGSFAAPFKFKNVAEVDLHPVYFQLYVSIGVFITCFLFAAFLPFNRSITDSEDAGTDFTFVPLGFPCGVLFVLSILFSFLAIPRIGLALGQGVWGGCAIITSFLLGSYKAQSLGNVTLAAVAIVLLLVGVIGITFCEAIGVLLAGSPEKDANAATGRLSDLSVGIETGLVPKDDKDAEKASLSTTLAGLGYALLVGLAGGSTLFPMEYARYAQCVVCAVRSVHYSCHAASHASSHAAGRTSKGWCCCLHSGWVLSRCPSQVQHSIAVCTAQYALFSIYTVLMCLQSS
jgi:hypothetical protein